VAHYRYETGSGEPLLACPSCSKSLTVDNGIALELVVDGKAVTVATRLDKEGRLVDTEDNAVANGFHSETQCGSCGEALTEWEVEEDEEDKDKDIEQRIAALSEKEARTCLHDVVACLTLETADDVHQILRNWGF
jgi:hypothetical protein